MLRALTLLFALFLAAAAAGAEESGTALERESFAQGRVLAGPGAVLPPRDRPAAYNALLADRLENLLPQLMRETGIDCWLVLNREYAEDPVYFSLVPRPSFAARRTTMLAFFQNDDGSVERLTVSRYPLGELYEPVWEGGDLDEQWRRLGELLAERDPKVIGINTSRHWPVADGLTAALHKRLLEVLSTDLKPRVESAEELAVRWIETRSAQQLEVYPHVVALARGVIAEAFSERVITPGVTTTDDVAWYIRQRFAGLDLDIWFMPDVNVQHESSPCDAESPFCGESGVIRRGDLLHTDVGICYLGLCTDTQEMGYVLRPGESAVPAPLVEALAVGNRWQDLLTAEFVTGQAGNEILAAARRAADAAGIASSVYTHPLGVFGHGPGPTIGMWDNQGPTPVRGDWPLHPSTAYAIEGNVKVETAAGRTVQIKLEQSAFFDGERVLYLAGRQTTWHVVR